MALLQFQQSILQIPNSEIGSGPSAISTNACRKAKLPKLYGGTLLISTISVLPLLLQPIYYTRINRIGCKFLSTKSDVLIYPLDHLGLLPQYYISIRKLEIR
mmetsp:Transcript_15701/g.22877  ORF Transcript_15701/g.22877 Transcript_15701/m.22877 type:complete len:102 (-) Transcript_15701:783-1088(-)